MSDTVEQTHTEFPCKSCGAKLSYAPGTGCLKCPHCGAENTIAPAGGAVAEQDYLAALRLLRDRSEQVERLVVRCQSCTAQTTLAENITAANCPFCGSPLVTKGESARLLKPACLLPFHVDAQRAQQAYRQWLAGLWFAPSALKRDALAGRLQGVYIPAWTYDCQATSDYTGQRGEDYWDTETYTAVENGKTVRRTRQVRKTRWYPAAGRVVNTFDDLLVLACQSLPQKHAAALEPWDLGALVSYQEEFLAGFTCQSYEVDLEQGFALAGQRMEGPIHQSIRSDIGGDHQRISSVSTSYDQVKFKHLLLPMWIASYRYKAEVYRFLVNARTGEVQGERPYSWVKITALVLVIAAIIAAVVLLLLQR